MNDVDFLVNFSDNWSSFAFVPCNSESDWKIIGEIDTAMDSVRRDFQFKSEYSSRLCSNFRFSRC